MMRSKTAMLVVLFSLIVFPLNGAAEEYNDEGDVEVFGLELEKLLNLGSGILALVLFMLALAAQRRTYSRRLKYVSIAFLLFAVKGVLAAHELLFSEWSFIDPVISVLDFAILLAFFVGVIKR